MNAGLMANVRPVPMRPDFNHGHGGGSIPANPQSKQVMMDKLGNFKQSLLVANNKPPQQRQNQAQGQLAPPPYGALMPGGGDPGAVGGPPGPVMMPSRPAKPAGRNKRTAAQVQAENSVSLEEVNFQVSCCSQTLPWMSTKSLDSFIHTFRPSPSDVTCCNVFAFQAQQAQQQQHNMEMMMIKRENNGGPCMSPGFPGEGGLYGPPPGQ